MPSERITGRLFLQPPPRNLESPPFYLSILHLPFEEYTLDAVFFSFFRIPSFARIFLSFSSYMPFAFLEKSREETSCGSLLTVWDPPPPSCLSFSAFEFNLFLMAFFRFFFIVAFSLNDVLQGQAVERVIPFPFPKLHLAPDRYISLNKVIPPLIPMCFLCPESHFFPPRRFPTNGD